jgi:hypothetical protein
MTYNAVLGDVTRTMTLSFELNYCKYSVDYSQAEFVPSDQFVIGNLSPLTITFPSFKLSSFSDDLCG